MAHGLPKGTKLPTLYNAEVVVERLLGEGGQGYVYQVTYNGTPKAVKIYKPAALRNPKGFYKNLQNNLKKGPPSDRFLWPVDLIKPNGKTFGYVMDLRPPEYKELVDFMNAKKPVSFASYRAAVTAALEMVSAFRVLHSKGYSYQDLSSGNFFINPANGRVLICDNDNVSEYGQNSGILGTPEYMAPEIVRGEKMPDTMTDRFSLAVIIFILITMTHPLEGKRYLCEYLSPEVERRLYGTEPIFILDPNDARNRPVAGVHTMIGQVWPELPSYVREMFTRQFSNEVMMTPQKRATEGEWQDLLIRFRSEIISCPACKGESFGYGKDPANPICSSCGKRLPLRQFGRSQRVTYPIPLMPGTVIYRSQLAASNIDVAGDPVFLVRVHPKDPRQLVMTNVSSQEVTCSRANTPRTLVKPNNSIVASPGTSVDAFQGTLDIL